LKGLRPFKDFLPLFRRSGSNVRLRGTKSLYIKYFPLSFQGEGD